MKVNLRMKKGMASENVIIMKDIKEVVNYNVVLIMDISKENSVMILNT